MKTLSAFSLLLLLAAALPGRATDIAVGNPNFGSPGLPGTYSATDPSTNEDPNQTTEEYSLVPDLGSVGDAGSPGGGGATNENIPDWTASTSGGVAGTDNPVAAMYAGTGGSSSDGTLPGTGSGYTFALINLSPASGEDPAQSGSLTYSGPSLGDFVIGQTYTLTIAIGQRLDTSTSARYTLKLLNDGSVAQETAATSATYGTFSDLSLTFIDTADTGAIGIEIDAAQSGSDNFEQANIDNVQLVETPEPATYAEIVCGLALLGAMSLRRRSA